MEAQKNAAANMSVTFSERLRAAMANAGMNQNMLAQAAGVSIGAVSGYVNGKLKPSRARLKALAEATGVTAECLMPGADSGQIPPVSRKITLVSAARCLRMSPTTVKAGMLSGELPIGRVIARPGRRDVVLITPEKLCEEVGSARFQEFFGTLDSDPQVNPALTT